MSDRPPTNDEDVEARIAEDPEAQPPVAGIRSQKDFDPFEALAINSDVTERLKESGRDWQKKVEASLALWLDEASLALRKEGLTGLAKAVREKSEETRRKAESGEYERDVQRLVSNVIGTIGRDIAGAAISAALAGFAASADRRAAPDKRPTDKRPEDESTEDKTPAPGADDRKADGPAD